jgi:hypothetical protein
MIMIGLIAGLWITVLLMVAGACCTARLGGQSQQADRLLSRCPSAESDLLSVSVPSACKQATKQISRTTRDSHPHVHVALPSEHSDLDGRNRLIGGRGGAIVRCRGGRCSSGSRIGSGGARL